VIGDEKRFKTEDRGGYVYELPGDEFECDVERGVDKCEWVAKGQVNPTNKIYFPYALNAMIESGVRVYFVDMATLRQIKERKIMG